MRQAIKVLLRDGRAWSVEEISRYLLLPRESVQDELHRMDDDGEVLMRAGWYRIAERAR
jgi:DNA-binding Lrp family transcriptional regulator